MQAQRAVDRIYIEILSDGRKIELELDLNATTIRQIKEQICKKLSILVEEQTLIHSGKVLPDSDYLYSYNIQKCSTLHLAVRFSEVCHVTLNIRQLWSNKVIQLHLRNKDTVLTLKKKICEELGIPVEEQSLIHCGQELDNGNELSTYNVSSQTTLHLKKKVTLTVKIPHAESTTIHASSSDTVNDVKEMIQEMRGIPVAQQGLVHAGRQLRNGHYQLSQYNIGNHSSLELIVHGRVQVLIEIVSLKETIFLKVTQNDSVADVKEQICVEKGIPTSNQTLLFEGTILDDDLQVLHCRVQNNSLLQLILPMKQMSIASVEIQIVSAHRGTITLHLNANDTVRDVKLQIHSRLCVPVDVQQLLWNDREMADSQLLSDYNIKEQCRLQLIETSSPEKACVRSSNLQILQELHLELSQYIDMTSLLPHLNPKQIFTEDEKYHLNDRAKSPQEKVILLLQYLARKNGRSVDLFIDALAEEESHSGHVELTKMLKEKKDK